MRRRPPGDASVLITEIDGLRCGLPLAAVDEVLAAASVELLPGGPSAAMGVLNLRGAPLVVVDGGACVDSPPRELRVTDRFVVLNGTDPRCALRVQAVVDLLSLPTDAVVSARSLGAPEAAAGEVGILDDGLLVVRDPKAFITADDAATIRRALEARAERAPV